MENGAPKKKGSCLKSLLIVFAVFIVGGLLIAVISQLSGNKDNATQNTDTNGEKQTESEQAEVEPNDKEKSAALFAEAQGMLEEGKYLEAISKIDEVILLDDGQEYKDFKTTTEEKLSQRKAELEASFEITEDKVENISFVKPKDVIAEGLIFHPYIGTKDSETYMLLRVGYQEPVDSSLMIFNKIKVRAGESLIEIPFNHMDKKSDVDILGSGMLELVDVMVKGDILKLLETEIPSNDEVVVRFEDISNKVKDYTITDGQKKVIADVLEYYSYIKQ